MIISLFRNNRPSVYIWLLIYTFALRGSFLWHPVFETPPEGAYLSPFLIHWIKDWHVSAFALQLTDIILIYLEAIMLNFILTGNSIFVRSSFIPAMVFITLSSLFGEWIDASVQTVAQLFLLISMMSLFRISGQETSRESIFYTSLSISIGSLFYFPVALFLLVILFGFLFRSYSLSGLILVLVGFLLPYYFIGLGEYYANHLQEYLYALQSYFYINPSPVVDISMAQEIFLVYLLILVVMGYMLLRSDREFKIVKHRRLVFIVLGYFVLSALAGPFISGSKLLYMQLIVLPATIFVSKVFNTGSLRFWHHILFLVLLLGAVGFQLYYLKII